MGDRRMTSVKQARSYRARDPKNMKWSWVRPGLSTGRPRARRPRCGGRTRSRRPAAGAAAPSAPGPGHVAAHHRPDIGVVDRLHNRGAAQPQVARSRAEADPARGRAVEVADQAGDHPGAHQVTQRGLVLGRRPGRRAGLAVVHAPAAAHDRSARQAEQGLQVRPRGRAQRAHGEVWRRGV
jgi:hypothetical protein